MKVSLKEKSKQALKKVQVLFLDRDGTINHDIGTYVASREQFRLIDRADEAVAAARSAGYDIVIVTNQAGLAKGMVTETQLDDVHSYMNELLARKEASCDRIYYCPSHPDYPHPVYDRFGDCRKPATGMVDRALEDYRRKGMEVDLEHSFFVGDKVVDIECALRSGLRPVLVRTGHGEEQECRERGMLPEYVADDLYEAVVSYILAL
ncbi:HAD family hydrolase [Prosthecochloris sp. N3]|uniref:D,D-heptose 1,7-bisphosphate phosphatase n=1 Tax=Prosthecochloris ethylica TaxID=2743976 RepID=A0ABR9XNX3_9CHLB|nr:HAD family hydrolase [Prosthecochloris ethylica]MBF0585826.1 HAD family hydrolase [Prosthecochloris ethylica]MBF0635736.1 HAD family hydrolase [Prosthecochloris ethylica]NUK47034.1 HAD family hydrolase [Prosthecochloris ethylica]RNA65514.1 HAD family hydrolase [Prosthecochloris sp. ZM_2]